MAGKYKTITVPEEVYTKIFKISTQKKISNWQVIQEALNFYETILKTPYKKKDLPRLDKASWYIWKLCKAVTIIEELNRKDDYNKVVEVLDQIDERIFEGKNENIKILKKLLEKYLQNPSKELKIEITTTTKLVIADIIIKLLFE